MSVVRWWRAAKSESPRELVRKIRALPRIVGVSVLGTDGVDPAYLNELLREAVRHLEAHLQEHADGE